MRITTKFKMVGGGSFWCRHTDNVYGGRNKKAVRVGKRALRKRLNTYLNKLLRYED